MINTFQGQFYEFILTKNFEPAEGDSKPKNDISAIYNSPLCGSFDIF